MSLSALALGFFLYAGAALPMLAMLALIEIFLPSRVWAVAFIFWIWVGLGYLWFDYWQSPPDMSTPLGDFGVVLGHFITGGVVLATVCYGVFVLKVRRA